MGIDKVSADILSRTTQILRSGSEADIKKLGQYLARFQFQKTENSETDLHKVEEVRQVIRDLRELSSSSAAMSLLEQKHLSRALLLLASKEIGLPISKTDKVDQLKRKIVHEIVESRLNSAAIRNPNAEPPKR